MITYIIQFLIGAFCYRARGGGLDKYERKLFHIPVDEHLSTQIRRLAYWDIPIAIGVTIVTANAAIGVLAILLAWTGHRGYFGGEFNLFDKANQNWRNYLRLTGAGVVTIYPLSLGLYILKQFGFYHGLCGIGGMAAGLLFVPCYLIWTLFGPTRYGNVGEFLLGGFMFLGLMATL